MGSTRQLVAETSSKDLSHRGETRGTGMKRRVRGKSRMTKGPQQLAFDWLRPEKSPSAATSPRSVSEGDSKPSSSLAVSPSKRLGRVSQASELMRLVLERYGITEAEIESFLRSQGGPHAMAGPAA